MAVGPQRDRLTPSMSFFARSVILSSSFRGMPSRVTIFFMTIVISHIAPSTLSCVRFRYCSMIHFNRLHFSPAFIRPFLLTTDLASASSPHGGVRAPLLASQVGNVPLPIFEYCRASIVMSSYASIALKISSCASMSCNVSVLFNRSAVSLSGHEPTLW